MLHKKNLRKMLRESHTRETIVAARLESICVRPSISKARKGNKSISHAAARPNVLRGAGCGHIY
jgi:nicotinamidase-related amidase